MDDKTTIPQINKTTKPPVEDGTTIPLSQPVKTSTSKKMLVGMLISFSKDGFGEYWPLYLGSNQIGSAIGKKNNILLKEKTVSSVHAHIGIRRLEDSSLVFELMDKGSSIGTKLNNKDHSEFNNYMKLKGGDKIRVGGYDLVFIDLDNVKLELSLNKSFQGGAELPDYTAQ